MRGGVGFEVSAMSEAVASVVMFALALEAALLETAEGLEERDRE